jgi:eukaryotic-like serine/threonine-protein kinase
MPAIGQTISHYRILEKIGRGGMGEVYKAEDLVLGRVLALKFLADDSASNAESIERFRREARAISAINHPNICTIFEIGEADGQFFIAMEYLPGQTLRAYANARPLAINDLLDIGCQIADALDTAHNQGVIHRDIKPENILLTTRHQIKILDFGLAKLTNTQLRLSQRVGIGGEPTADFGNLTYGGQALGTIAYMSPEQMRGEEIDRRTDLFSFSTVLYELASGRLPSQGETMAAVTDSILHAKPAPLSSLNAQIPPALERIVAKNLEKDRTRRCATAAEFKTELDKLRRDHVGQPRSTKKLLSRPAVLLYSVILMAVILAAAGAIYRHYSRLRWVHERALPEVQQLVFERKGMQAWALLKRAEAYAPGDPAVAKLKAATLYPAAVITTPEGANAYARDYQDTGGEWQYLGKTPLRSNRLPLAFYAFKISKDGYETVYATGTTGENTPLRVQLDPVGTLQAGMVRVPVGSVDPTKHNRVKIAPFLISKFEVTNREYKQFIDAGGYRDPKYWKVPFEHQGRKLSFNEAMKLLRDKTDRPGPSTWELGSFTAGEEDYPVNGVSWYEAMAFAAFSGMNLPTLYHWFRAADMGRFSDILQTSNFQRKGPAKVGSFPSLGPFGTYDMAGNVKEWCLNSTGDRKYIVGGSSTDPPYMYDEPDARLPFDRSPGNGIRLVKYQTDDALRAELTAPVSFQLSDYRNVKPVSDEVFKVYRGLFSYDHTALDSKIESEDDSSPYWRKQRITFNASYGGERVIAYLFLPKDIAPPYQTIVYFPHGGAQSFRTVEDTQFGLIQFLIKSGRALMFPIYKDTYERLGTPPQSGTSAERDETIQQSKDLRRSVDYLATRNDININKLGYYGISWGSVVGPIMIATEDRFRVAVFAAGGCNNEKVLPEIDPINFAPRVKIPVLMINGRYDFELPLETCQEPMFRAIGSAPEAKRHVLYDTGHSPPQLPVMKEALNWLDQYLGPVK